MAHLANDPARAPAPYAAKASEVPWLEPLRNASNCWLTAGMTFTPRQLADASTNTANIKLKPDFSLMNRGITFDRRLPSANNRSKRLVVRIRFP